MIEQSVLEKLEFEKILNQISKYSSTENGKNLILNLYPTTVLSLIKNEGEIVDEAKDILNKTGYPPLEYLSDINNVLSESRIEGSILSSSKVLEILKLAKISRLLIQFLKTESKDESGFKEIIPSLFSDKLFEHRIEKIINEQGEVKENASSDLSQIRKDINSKRNELVKSINRIIKILKEDDIVREDYLTLRDGRMVIPVKAEHKRHIRGFIHSESSTGQTVYIEPEETLDLNNDIISLSFAERREIERILKELTKMIGQSSEILKSSLETIAYIDSVFARAKYSIEIIGSLPQVDNLKPIFISEGRHPILLKKLSRQQTVPLSFELNKDRVVIITGPNAGGKTVVLKTIGILSIMIQAGIHVPVNSNSNFHIFKDILIDIGDQQSIEDDLSTFSSHLKNLKNIIDNAGQDSLILLDEIGTGTDPEEGSALAAAILSTLLDKGSIVFASTHHGSLKVIAYNINGMQNAAMEFDHSNLSPTYKFNLGVPGSSYAFEIAKRTGMPDEVLSKAKNNINSDKHNLENFLSELEEKSNRLNKKLKELEIENSRLEGLSALYKKSYEKIEKEKKEILKKIKSDGELYLENVNKKIEKVIKDLRESGASKEVIKDSKKVIQDIKLDNNQIFTEKVEKISEKIDFTIGDFVGINNSSTTGKIIELNHNKGKATILSGSIKMQVNLSDLFETKEKKSVIDNNFSSYQISDVNYRIDIRGEKPEEAEFKIIKFLDDAYQSSLERVEILHGKGTGALKKTVWEILKHHEKVKNFYFTAIEFGGEGITIAELK
ncbi:MAG TPA: endonuclease MutS2 [Ignavibacteriales bacterium]|nr:endonuclease MutS2 [Ignavibacteriales bacterium]